MRPKKEKKDQIEIFQQNKIKDITSKTKYFEALLSAQLPRYNAQQDQNQQVMQKIVLAKRLMFDENHSRQAFAKSDSPIKLRKTYENLINLVRKKQLDSQESIKLRTEQEIQQNHVTKRLEKVRDKQQTFNITSFQIKETQQQEDQQASNRRKLHQDQLNPTYSKQIIKVRNKQKSWSNLKEKSPGKNKGILKSPNKCTQHEQQVKSKSINYPYSILKHLEGLQKDRPQDQRRAYKYREIHNIRQYSLDQVNCLINDLNDKAQKNDEKTLSVTDQFIMASYLDLKIQKLCCSKIEMAKEVSNRLGNQKVHKQTNQQLMKALIEAQIVWELYEKKLKMCPDITSNNPKYQKQYMAIRQCHIQISKIEDAMKKEKVLNQAPTKSLVDFFSFDKSQNGSSKMINPKDKSKQFSEQVKGNHKQMTKQTIQKKVKTILRKFKAIILQK